MTLQRVETAGAVSFPWWLVLIQGVASIILGILLVTAPTISMIVLVRWLGWFWLLKGILFIVAIFTRRPDLPKAWLLVSGALGVIAGLAVLEHPLISAILVPVVLVIFIAVDGIVIGISNLLAAFQGAGVGAGVLGVISLVLGILLLGSPLMGAAAMPFVLGSTAIVGGIVATVTAFRLRGA